MTPPSERAQQMLADRLDAARDTVALADWQRVHLPPIARQAYPGIDLADPLTLPEPRACAEGRPWGPDAYGSVWGTTDERWASYIEGGPATMRARCRNRWKDRATLLCGTHLNAWQRTLDDAAKRLRRHEWHTEATELCRRLAVHTVEAEPNPGGLLLRPDAARLLAELLDRAAAHGLVEYALAHRDELLNTPTPNPPTGD
jgi:sugar phosphate isomerase/epimerase